MSVPTIIYIILAVLAALVLALVQYYYKEKNKRPKHWKLFSALRFITYFSVFLLLINPKFENTTYTIEKPSLVVAVDNSSSIQNLGKSKNVSSLVTQLLQDEEINKSFSVEEYTFGENFEKNDSLSFSEKQSNLNQAITNLDKLYKNQTAPVVFISDGNQTYGQDYTFSAKQFNQTIFPVVVGDTTQYVDLKIAQLNANRYAFINNKFPVEIFVNYTGDKNITQRFTIKQGKQIVYTENITFGKQKTSSVVNATLPANSVGVKTYSVSIQALENEKNTENNTKNFAVEVIDEKTNVLLVSDIIHPDLGSFKKSIEHNQQRQATIKDIDDDIDWGNYQLIILYQPNSKFSTAYEQINRLGLNSLTVTGTKTDYQFLNRNQTIFTKQTSNQEEDYLANYNANYTSFQLEDIGFNKFPPLQDKFGDISFSTTVNTFLNQSINGYVTESPLLATVENGNQRLGFIFGENIWRWRAQSFLQEEDFTVYDEFFGKLIQYLASNKRRERLQLDYNSFYNSGENIVFQAQYFDKNYEFDARGKLNLTVKNKATNASQIFPFLLKNNHYEVDLSNLSAGDYSFTTKVENEQISKSGNFTIVDYDVEKQYLNANLNGLLQLNSEVYFLEDFSKIKSQLLNNKQFKPIQKSKTEISPLIDWFYLLVIIIFCLSSEWFLRKYYGLI